MCIPMHPSRVFFYYYFSLVRSVWQSIFFELDRGNRGFITFQDFAILSGVRIPKVYKAGKRKSTLPGMQ